MSPRPLPDTEGRRCHLATALRASLNVLSRPHFFMMENRGCLKADLSLQLFCPLKVPIGHDYQLRPLRAI
jgi:hypothetical protein